MPDARRPPFRRSRSRVERRSSVRRGRARSATPWSPPSASYSTWSPTTTGNGRALQQLPPQHALDRVPVLPNNTARSENRGDDSFTHGLDTLETYSCRETNSRVNCIRTSRRAPVGEAVLSLGPGSNLKIGSLSRQFSLVPTPFLSAGTTSSPCPAGATAAAVA